MSISRKTTSPRSPRKTASVRVRKTVHRSAETEPVIAEPAHASTPSQEPIVNPDYKRELIRAHAAMRRPYDPVQMLSVWAGVLATFAVIVGTWWWASEPGLMHAWRTPWTVGFEPAVEGAKNFQESVSHSTDEQAQALSADLQRVSDRLNALDAQNKTSQHSLQKIADLIQADASSTSGTSAVPAVAHPLFRSASTTLAQPVTTSTPSQSL